MPLSPRRSVFAHALACLAAALAVSPVASAQPDQAASEPAEADPSLLLPGDLAPSIAGLSWIKGSPQAALEPGVVHIVDAWATWCLPCERTLPHLSRVARAYGDRIRVLGVATWEQRFPLREGQASFESRVRDYVRTREDRIAYDIAWDETGVFERAWMRAARQVSIPTVFLVDDAGKVAWVGHPMMGMDEALAQLLAGTFDKDAAFDRLQRTRDAHAGGMKDATRLQIATREERWDDAIAIAGDIFDRDPQMFASSGVTKARLMLTRGKASEALSFIEGILSEATTLTGFARAQRLELLASFAEALLDTPVQASEAASETIAQRTDLASRLAALGESIIADATRPERSTQERDAAIKLGEPLVVVASARDALTLAGVRMRLKQLDAASQLITAALALDPDPSQEMQAQAMQRQLASLQANPEQAHPKQATPPAPQAGTP
jgi:thiol-disulfide isomerase/thioredoxin